MGAFHSWLVTTMAVFCCTADFSFARTLPTSSAADADAVSAGGVTQLSAMASSADVRCEVPGCGYDMLLYCLSNGVIIMGSCSLKKTLCTNGTRNELTLARDGWGVCFQATYNVQYPLEQMVIVHTDDEGSGHGDSDSQESNPGPRSSRPETSASVLQDLEEAMHNVDDNKDAQRVSQSQPIQQASDTSQLLANLAAVGEAMGVAKSGESSEAASRTGTDNPSKPPAGGVTAEEEQENGPLLLERQLMESFGINRPNTKVTHPR